MFLNVALLPFSQEGFRSAVPQAVRRRTTSGAPAAAGDPRVRLGEGAPSKRV